jgi:hypothetical protein
MLRKHQRSVMKTRFGNLHLSRVELHCKLQEKLHRVTWPLIVRKNLTPFFSLSRKNFEVLKKNFHLPPSPTIFGKKIKFEQGIKKK